MMPYLGDRETAEMLRRMLIFYLGSHWERGSRGMVNLSDFGSGNNIGVTAGRNKYGSGWLLRMLIFRSLGVREVVQFPINANGY
jgi:hypothetical protein